MANFLTGWTFSASEQVTNTKMNNQVNLASISNIQASEMATNFLSSLVSSSGKLPQQNIYGLGSITTNASLINVSSTSAFNVYYSTYGSIATFVGALVGQKFTLISQQASFPVIVDTGSFKLASNWIPAKQYDNISLIWDGSAFIEIGRVTT